jgi:histidinol-phosphate/aromatic aminotransferase/cobyric acid decarboxylase-like protein
MRLVAQPAAPHGGRGEAPIDLSASLNPLGPHPGALAAVRRCELGRYPEPDAGALAAAAAARHGLDRRAVVPVPGASWGLWLAAVALLGPGDACVSIGPCFGENGRCARIAGAEHREMTAWPPDPAPACRALDDALASRPAMLMAANPGNPSGQAVPGSELRDRCHAHPGTWFLLDEAFAGFAPSGTSLLDSGPPPPNALVVRSLTKELALPGLRMGYAVAHPDVAGRLLGILPAWPLSAPAIAAGVAGLGDPGHGEAGAAVGRRHVAALAAGLAAAGARPFPSDANYLVAHAPGALDRLHRRGIAVRDCASFGLPGNVRLAAPRPADLPGVLRAIRELDLRG